MFIAHLPAGYLATSLLLGRARPDPGLRRRLLALGMAAGVAPDLDLLWFYLVDDRRRVHHAYLPHLPLACAAALACAALALWVLRASRAAWIAWMVVAASVFLHLVLDTTAGGIRWLWPFSDAELVLSHVEARYPNWVMNFVLHWTFALELLIVAAALAAAYLRRRARGSDVVGPMAESGRS